MTRLTEFWGIVIFLSLVFGKEIDTVADKINQFRNLIRPQIYPNSSHVHDFLQDDHYVHQWLKKGDLNVNQTRNIFIDHLRWRSTEKIDQILAEDWQYFKSEYPQFVNLGNKLESPVAEVWLADWNIRRAVMSGHSKRLLRYMTSLLEMTQRELVEIRRKQENVTSAVEIIDLHGFNPWQHSCVSCVPIYLRLSWLWETQYPNIWDSVYMINVNPTFKALLKSMESNFNRGQKRVLKLYANRLEWLSVFDKNMKKDQRSVKFGGTLIRPDH